MEFENDRSQKLQARHLLLGRSRDYESHGRETFLQRAVWLEDARQSAPRRRRLYPCSNQRGRHRWSDGDGGEGDSAALEFVRGGRERRRGHQSGNVAWRQNPRPADGRHGPGSDGGDSGSFWRWAFARASKEAHRGGEGGGAWRVGLERAADSQCRRVRSLLHEVVWLEDRNEEGRLRRDVHSIQSGR